MQYQREKVKNSTGTLLPCGVPVQPKTITAETGGLQHEFRRILKSDG